MPDDIARKRLKQKVLERWENEGGAVPLPAWARWEGAMKTLERSSETTERSLDRPVVETRGHLVDGQIAHFQVTLKVGFRLE